MIIRQQLPLSILLILIVLFIITGCEQSSPDIDKTPTPVSTIRAQGNNDDVVRVGVLVIRSAVATNAQYGPLVSYLEEIVKRPFELVPLDQEAQFTEVAQGNLQFTFNNPLAGEQLRRLYSTELLATLSRANTGTEFSGLIIVRPDSDINTINDLIGKHGACVAFQTAAAGCAFQIFHLQQNGIDPFTDFASFVEVPSQDNIVLGVLNSTFDVGFVRTGQLEKMVAEETILSINELTILDQTEDDFFYPHTTRLYPEWPFAALANTDSELKGDVREALLALTAEDPAMVTANANTFVPMVDYTAIDELIEALQLRSWDSLEQ